MSSVKITITLAEKILKKVDNIRGLVPRSTYIADIVEKKCDRSSKKL